MESQQDVLLADSCERVFEEKINSREQKRGALREAFDYCRESDVLVMARLDRLGRSSRELIDLMRESEERGAGFRSLRESLDTTTAGGRPIFHVFRCRHKSYFVDAKVAVATGPFAVIVGESDRHFVRAARNFDISSVILPTLCSYRLRYHLLAIDLYEHLRSFCVV